MKRNKMFVVGVLAATFLLLPTGFWAEGDHCSHGQRKNCLLGSFSEDVEVPAFGMKFKALVTFSPGGGVVETNNAQGQPVTVHGSWAATNDDQFALTFITLGLQPPLGQQAGLTAKTRETVTLSDSGDSFTAAFQSDLMDANGNVFLTLIGTAHGKRILIEPL
jgi:hypothetical protein